MEDNKLPTPIKEYREKKQAFKEWLSKHYSDTGRRRKKKNKTPWFYMTKGKCFNYETRREEWGDNTNYYSVPSMSKLFNDKHKLIYSREAMIQRMIDAKLKDWDKAHPRPIPKGQSDLFESQFIPQWVSDRGKERERIESIIRAKYDKIKVCARFKLKEGVYTKGYSILCGYLKDHNNEYKNVYNSLKATNKESLFKSTRVVKQAQRIADNLAKMYPGKDGPQFISLQISFDDGTCPKILIPN